MYMTSHMRLGFTMIGTVTISISKLYFIFQHHLVYLIIIPVGFHVFEYICQAGILNTLSHYSIRMQCILCTVQLSIQVSEVAGLATATATV